MTLNFRTGKFTNPSDSVPYVRQIFRVVRAIPGMQGASASFYTPLTDLKGETIVHTDAMPPGSPQAMTQGNQATPEYFQTLGIPLVAGRDFSETDDRNSSDVYIVNQGFAKPNLDFQRPLLRITTGATLGRSSAGVKLRPRMRDTPMVGKKEAETSVEETRCASVLPIQLKLPNDLWWLWRMHIDCALVS